MASRATAASASEHRFIVIPPRPLIFSKHSLENRVHVAQLTLQREPFGDLLRREYRANLRIALDRGAEIAFLFPGAHGVPLHDAIGLLAQHAGGGKIEQYLAAEDQAAREIEIAPHARG